MRTFIAIELSKEIQETLAKLESELRTTGADVKWVKPQNIHLTLKFLGEINPETIEEIKPVVWEVAKKYAHFRLTLSELGAFPKIDYPRVIWIDVNEGKDRVLKIAKELEERLEKFGLAPEKRPFSAHITIGRVRSALNRNSLVEKIKKINQPPALNYIVDRLTLYKSTLTGSGPIYEIISQAPLSFPDK